MDQKGRRLALLLLVAVGLVVGCPRGVPTSEQIQPPPPVPRGRIDLGPVGEVKVPVGLTADPAEEYDPAPSPDGRVMAYVSHRRGNADVYVRFLPGSGRVGDFPISPHYAPDLDPTWSPTGRHLAFVSMRDDPKGDVYVYSVRSGNQLKDEVRDEILRRFGDGLGSADEKTRAQLSRISDFLERWEPLTRLADSETEDRSPAFSPDGRLLYYTSRRPGEQERVYARDLEAGKRIKIASPGKDPAPSPDGKYLAYATHDCPEPTGCIRVLRLSDNKSVAVTRGYLDGFPTWAPDSRTLYFSRYSEDTSGDGKLDVIDRPALFVTTFDPRALDKKLTNPARRLTTGQHYDLFPAVAGDLLYFASDDGLNTDIFSIPRSGVFPVLDDAEEIVKLADALFERPELQLLYLEDTLVRGFDARLAMWAGDVRLERGDLKNATAHYARVESPIGAVGLARVALAKDGSRKRLEALVSQARTNGHADAGAEALLALAGHSERAGDTLRAAESYARVRHVFPEAGSARAEALLGYARMITRLGQSRKAVAVYHGMLDDFGDSAIPAERRRHAAGEREKLLTSLASAVGKKLERNPVLPGLQPEDLPDVGVATAYGERAATGIAAVTIADAATEPEAIGRLRDLARQKANYPVVPAVIRNEIGDLYLRLGNPKAAINEHLAAGELGDVRQTGRARLSIAKALLSNAEYDAAADELGRVARAGDISITLAGRAEQARVRVLLAKAEQAFLEKDILLARKAYRRVLEVDARDLRAHRGLIASYAALHEEERAKKIYESALAQSKDDATLIYATGLVYTYLKPEEKWLPRAKKLLERAAGLDGNAVFPHQTLGFTYEKLEELDIERRQMEKAVDQYLLALALNDVRHDAKNEAALLLNTGNAFFNLKNHHRAYDLYTLRFKTDIRFDVKERELVFRERFAKAAFHSNRIDESVERYNQAIAFLDTFEQDMPEHRARLLDERALALAEAGEHARAAEGFLAAAKLNSSLANKDKDEKYLKNEARALRNAAIHLFRANGHSNETLARSLGYLENSLKSVEEYGVVEPPKARGGKLYTHNMQIGLTDDISEAASGFSQKGEQELIWTFIGRIYASVDDPERALKAFETKRALMPKKVPREQKASLEFKKALLDNQIANLHWQLGDTDNAWELFLSSYQRSRQVSNLHGMLTNADNLARVALATKTRASERRESALALIEESVGIARQVEKIKVEKYLPSLATERAALLLARNAAVPKASPEDPLDKTIRNERNKMIRLRRDLTSALEWIQEAIEGTEEEEKDGGSRQALLLEAGSLQAALGDFESAKISLAAAAKSPLPGLSARAKLTSVVLLGEGKIADVLTALEKVPPPAFEPSFDASQVEPYYRHLAANTKDTIGWIERWRGLRRALDARGAIPRPHDTQGAAAHDALMAAIASKDWAKYLEAAEEYGTHAFEALPLVMPTASGLAEIPDDFWAEDVVVIWVAALPGDKRVMAVMRPWEEVKLEPLGPIALGEDAKRVYAIGDVGLFDGAWLPENVTATWVSSISHLVAAHYRRGSFRKREVTTANAIAEAGRADVLRLAGPARVPRGRPAAAWWEAPGKGPAPARRVAAAKLASAAPTANLLVATVPKDADRETLLRLSDLWAHAGIARVEFAALPTGHAGLTKEEAEVFAADAYDRVLGVGKLAFKEKRWSDALAAFDRVLYLLDSQGSNKGRKGFLRIQAITALNAHDPQRAVGYSGTLVKLLRDEKSTGRVMATSLILHGKLLQHAENYRDAVAALEEAVKIQERLGNQKSMEAGRTELGIALENAREIQKALLEFQKSLALAQGLDNPKATGAAHRKIGRIHLLYLQDNKAADEAFRRAAEAFESLGDADGRDEAWLEVGLVAERRGRLEQAAKHYESVRARAIKRKNKALEAKAVLFLANTAWFKGDYQNAFTHVRNVRRIADELDSDRLRFLARSTEGLIQWTLNDFERSMTLQEEALSMASDTLKSDAEIASTHNNIGLVHRSAGRYEKAVASFEAALKIDRALGTRWGIAYDLRNLGMTYLHSADPRRAQPSLEEAASLAREIGDRINAAKATLALGDLAVINRDWPGAKASYQKALEIADDVRLPEVSWRAHKGLARVARETGNIKGARDSLDAALAVVEDMRASIKLEEFKNSFITNKLDLYADAIQLALDHPAAGSDPALTSWGYSERARARSFIDLLANRDLSVASKRDRRLLREQRDLKDQILELEETNADPPALDALREKYRDLLVEIRASNPQLSAFVTVDPPGIAEVRNALRGDTALIEYYVAEKEVIVWTITRDAIEVTRIKIDRKNLTTQVKAYLEAIQTVQPVDKQSTQLHTLLVAPALTKSVQGQRYLGIVPHGILHYIPWPALSDGKSALVDRYSLFTAPSAGVIPYTATKKQAGKPRRQKMAVLAIGNPDLGDRSFELPFAELEVSDMRFRFDSIEVLTKEKATERWVIDNVERFRVIHFASHGEFDSVNPLFSSLKLARSSDADGSLAAHEVFGLELTADLVTMSACQTGLAKIEGGDELIGLNRAFLYAGTQSILSTLWRVSDASTAVLVKHFYRQYTAEAKADALRESMRSVREYYPHPAYWAAFSLTGDWR